MVSCKDIQILEFFFLENCGANYIEFCGLLFLYLIISKGKNAIENLN